MILYFSSASLNTHRFVEKLGLPNRRILRAQARDWPVLPYILICPTYADHTGAFAVPKPVIHFLNNHRTNMVGVIGSGNRNFGTTYGLAADIISAKCEVPVLYKFELAGTETDVERVRRIYDDQGLQCP